MAARARKDWAAADNLRAQISEFGYEVLDVAAGFELKPKLTYSVLSRIGDLRRFTDKTFSSALGMIADGYIEDLTESLVQVKKYAPADTAILILISGKLDISSLLGEIDSRTFVVAVEEGVGWAEAANAIIKFSPAPYVAIMDPSTRLLGDAISPALEKLQSGDWAAAGWRGGLVNVDDDWRSTEDKGVGEVDVLFSYFLFVNQRAALECGGFNNRAIYYRNADIEFSLRLRQAHGRLLQMDLPLEQARHHGYYDTDPAYRDEQSKKTYDRILERFRGKNEILVARR
jgi:hypothetical protein